jgi:tetratricopeptide (TPR) repeat protein
MRSALAQDPPNVFDLPALQQEHAKSLVAIATLQARGLYAEAETILRKAIERVPHDRNCHYNLARVLARQNRHGEALSALEKSVALGFRDPKQIKEDDNFFALRDQQRFQAILAKATEPLESAAPAWRYEVKPATVDDKQVLVSARNTAWNAQLGVFCSFFEPSQAAANEPVVIGHGEAGDLLRSWYLTGTAAGNHGDFYDNHDGDHSNIDFQSFPQLTRIEFSDEVKRRKLHTGLQLSFLYNTVTIGNSSTAVTSGPFWRSQPRLALTRPQGALKLYRQYIANHLYFYPEHRDHDPRRDGSGYGDVYPANTPYVIISQGSSGSDQAFMNAVGTTLAAFRPAVKEKLVRERILMPTIQMIFRSSNTMGVKASDYLSGRAHPTVFERKHINEDIMVKLAHGMTVDSVPPMVELNVIEEDEPVVGRDYFDVGPREKLFDTPCAIARVVKSTRYTRRMVVSAENSRDLNKAPLTYIWKVLRGDPDRVEINKLNEVGSKAELLVSYHERRPVAFGSDMESNRVDIGVFVHNGDYYSAPAFICFQYLANEKRVYDDRQRIRVVDYNDPDLKDQYVDPWLDFSKDWRDEYRYAGDGSLAGWTRIRGEQRQEFTAEGQLILEKDDNGQPTSTVAVRYVVKRRPDGTGILQQTIAR